MTQTNAERQRAYRARMQDEDSCDVRLSMTVSALAHAALGRIAARNGTTRREALERLLVSADMARLRRYWDATARTARRNSDVSR